MPVLPRPSFLPLHAAGVVARSLLLGVLPQGGQHTARRNAWNGMVRDAQLARGRREADQAMDLAIAAAHVQTSSSAR